MVFINSKRKFVIVLLALILFVSIFNKLFDVQITKFFQNRRLLYSNWKVWLPAPNDIDIIYNFEYREGEVLEIWYYSKKNIDKIIKNNYFGIINSEEPNKVLEHYYDCLSVEDKAKFKSNVNLEELLNKNNYYVLYVRPIGERINNDYSSMQDDSDYLLLILDTKDNKIYFFERIY